MPVRERASPLYKEYTRGIYRDAMFERYRWCNAFIQGRIVLDIPTGVGWGASTLKNIKGITCVDSSVDAIKDGKILFPELQFICGRMQDIPIKSNSIEAVVCLDGFEHISAVDQRIFIREVCRILTMDGLLLMTVPIKKSDNPFHLHEPSIDEVKIILRWAFKRFQIGSASENVISVAARDKRCLK